MKFLKLSFGLSMGIILQLIDIANSMSLLIYINFYNKKKIKKYIHNLECLIYNNMKKVLFLVAVLIVQPKFNLHIVGSLMNIGNHTKDIQLPQLHIYTIIFCLYTVFY